VAAKLVNLRIFDDADGKLNLSLLNTGGSALMVPNFTLYGDPRNGRRPSYVDAAPFEEGQQVIAEQGHGVVDFWLTVPAAAGHVQPHHAVIGGEGRGRREGGGEDGEGSLADSLTSGLAERREALPPDAAAGTELKERVRLALVEAWRKG
jgi:hypothetical protein